MSAAGAALAALAGTLALAPAIAPVLRRAGIVDHPGSRSSHDTPTLRGGGVAPALAGVTVLLVAGAQWGVLGLAVAAAGMALIGLAEDIVGVPPLPRFGLQLVVGFSVVPLVAPDGLGAAAVVGLAVGGALWLAAFTNVFNFMDGINGISGAQAGVAGLAFALVGTAVGAPMLVLGGAVVCACALGFLPWNLPRASMFLGDVGSYFFGGLLAAVALAGVASGVPFEAMLAPLVLSVADTATTLVRRVLARETWWSPHRSHVYQRLVVAGWSHTRVSVMVAAFVATISALGAVSLSPCGACRVVADTLVVAVVVLYLLTPRLLAHSTA